MLLPAAPFLPASQAVAISQMTPSIISSKMICACPAAELMPTNYFQTLSENGVFGMMLIWAFLSYAILKDT